MESEVGAINQIQKNDENGILILTIGSALLPLSGLDFFKRPEWSIGDSISFNVDPLYCQVSRVEFNGEEVYSVPRSEMLKRWTAAADSINKEQLEACRKSTGGEMKLAMKTENITGKIDLYPSTKMPEHYALHIRGTVSFLSKAMMIFNNIPKELKSQEAVLTLRTLGSRQNAHTLPSRLIIGDTVVYECNVGNHLFIRKRDQAVAKRKPIPPLKITHAEAGSVALGSRSHFEVVRPE